jgi:sec-independent protein translocase protein TatC
MTATAKPPRPPADEYVGEEMTLFEHLEELRQRIVKSAAAIAVGFVVGFVFQEPVFQLLIRPYCDLDPRLRAISQVFDPDRCQLIFTNVLGGFFLVLKSAAIVAVLIAAPVVCYQIWRFVSPGLRPVERRYALPFVLLTFVLFAGGAVFAYLVIPRGLEFLLAFAGPDVVSLMDANEYLGFILKMMLGFGLSFEFPLAIALFSLMGVLTAETLRRYRRHAIFAAFVLAAVITPTQDPFTMVVMALPLSVMYEGNVLFARLVERSRRRRAASDLALPE